MLFYDNNKLLHYFPMGNLIKNYREKAQLTQKQLADAVGTSQQQIDLLERGKRRLTTGWMERISKALKLSHPSLLMGQARPGTDVSGIEMHIIELFRSLDAKDKDNFLRMLRAFGDTPEAADHLASIERAKASEKKSGGKNARSKIGI